MKDAQDLSYCRAADTPGRFGLNLTAAGDTRARLATANPSRVPRGAHAIPSRSVRCLLASDRQAYEPTRRRPRTQLPRRTPSLTGRRTRRAGRRPIRTRSPSSSRGRQPSPLSWVVHAAEPPAAIARCTPALVPAPRCEGPRCLLLLPVRCSPRTATSSNDDLGTSRPRSPGSLTDVVAPALVYANGDNAPDRPERARVDIEPPPARPQ
jgi:hypothetical protein